MAMTFLPLLCSPIDALLGGGLEVGIVTKLFGESGTGKTNWCLQAVRECAETGRKTVYIDSEGVSIERLRQICSEAVFQDVLRTVLFYRPESFSAQETMIAHAVKMRGVGLIVIDTVNQLFRGRRGEEHQDVIRSFVRQMTTLQVAARTKHMVVLVTEQVYTNIQGEIRPFTSRQTDSMVKTVVRLSWLDPTHREAILEKHRTQPEGLRATFTITPSGLL
jgi:DNA repair protein RadB